MTNNEDQLRDIKRNLENLNKGYTDLWTNFAVAVCDIQSTFKVLVNAGLVTELELKKVRAKVIGSKRKGNPPNILELANSYIHKESDKEFVDVLAEEFGVDVKKMHEKAKELKNEKTTELLKEKL